jgi:hypothetical protein
MWEIDEGDLSRFRCHVSHGSGRMALDAWLWTHGSGRKSTPLAGERAALARKLYHQAKKY